MDARKILAGLLLLVVAWFLFRSVSTYAQSPVDAGTIQMYGSPSCPWCVKQMDYFTKKGVPFVFTNCDTEQCPSFVEGFPTLVVAGQIKSGYTETAGPLTA